MRPPFFRKLVQRIREEFENAPDLRMTISEAARFFALDFATCERVLAELLRSGSVTRGTDQRYGSPPRFARRCHIQAPSLVSEVWSQNNALRWQGS